MKYEANPVIVDAYEIIGIRDNIEMACLDLKLDNDEVAHVDASMTARYFPKIRDYYVIQEDGYTYINPKSVFERKYSPVENESGDGYDGGITAGSVPVQKTVAE